MTTIASAPAIDRGIAQLLGDLSGPTLPFLVWRRAQTILGPSSTDPAGDLVAWLSDHGYSFDPTAVGSSLVGLRATSLTWWAARYRLFRDDGGAHDLYIGPDGEVAFDGGKVVDDALADGRLTFTDPSTKAMVSLTFTDSLEGLTSTLGASADLDAAADKVIAALGGLQGGIAGGAVPEQACEGEIRPATARQARLTPDPGAPSSARLRGRRGTFTLDGSMTVTSGDPLDAWNGVYTVYLADANAGFVVSPVRLTVAAAAGPIVKGLNTGNAAITLDTEIPDAGVTFASNVLTWGAPGTGSQIRFFMDATGLRRFDGQLAIDPAKSATRAWGELARPLAAPAKFEINTTKLPDAIAKAAYAAPLEAGGTSGTITWSLVDNAGTLPDGLAIMGDRITGTPSGAGISSFIVNAQTGTGASATSAQKALTITVVAPDYSSGNFGLSIASSVALFVGGIATPLVIFLIASRMQAKHQGEEDKKLKAIETATEGMNDAFKTTAAKATTDLKKLTDSLSDLKKQLDADINARKVTQASIADLQAKLDTLSTRLQTELASRTAELDKLRQDIAKEQDASKKKLLEEEQTNQEVLLDLITKLNKDVHAKGHEAKDTEQEEKNATASDTKAVGMIEIVIVPGERLETHFKHAKDAP